MCASVLSIQTAGLAFGSTGLCSYRVRVVGGSRAEHLTVESYTIIISLQSYLLSYLLLLVFHHHRRRLSVLGTGESSVGLIGGGRGQWLGEPWRVRSTSL